MIIFFVITPVIILYLETQFSIMKKIGAVLICYAIGLILGNIDVLLDADTVIILGSALICSLPFVPVIAGALKNREIILTGLTVGIAGYAVGNYLGVLIAFILK
jgi:uncharacterized membrane protein